MRVGKLQRASCRKLCPFNQCALVPGALTAELLQLKRHAAGACLLQEDDFGEDGWEDVAAPGIAAAGGNSQGGLLAGVPDDDDEDWEDVL